MRVGQVSREDFLLYHQQLTTEVEKIAKEGGASEKLAGVRDMLPQMGNPYASDTLIAATTDAPHIVALGLMIISESGGVIDIEQWVTGWGARGTGRAMIAWLRDALHPTTIKLIAKKDVKRHYRKMGFQDSSSDTDHMSLCFSLFDAPAVPGGTAAAQTASSLASPSASLSAASAGASPPSPASPSALPSSLPQLFGPMSPPSPPSPTVRHAATAPSPPQLFRPASPPPPPPGSPPPSPPSSPPSSPRGR